MSPNTVAASRAHRGAIADNVTATCGLCDARHLCWGESNTNSREYTRRKVKRGAVLYRMSEGFENLYAIRSGFVKASMLLEDGREQVTAFKMSGDILGLDGIGADQHMSNAMALVDGEVCIIPYERVVALSQRMPALASDFNRMLSREIAGDQGVMALLGSMCAQERVVVFLLNLAQRFKARGYSGTEFALRMTREEIGSYLGLKLETVSRILSRLQAWGLIEIEQNRNVLLRDLHTLQTLTARSAKLQLHPMASDIQDAFNGCRVESSTRRGPHRSRCRTLS